MKDKNFLFYKLFILIFVIMTLSLSLYLAYEYYQPEPIGCPLSSPGENDCETVRQSPYSQLLGIKLPVWGALFFTVFFIVLVTDILKINKFKYRHTALFTLATFGILFETVMTMIQIFVIEALCKWCLMVETSVIAIFFLSISLFIQTDMKILLPIIKNKLFKSKK